MTDKSGHRPRLLVVDELLTPDEVSAILKVTKPWLYAQVQRGRLPSVRFNGRSLRFKPEDVQHFIDQQYLPLIVVGAAPGLAVATGHC